jgi:hypothetical protein
VTFATATRGSTEVVSQFEDTEGSEPRSGSG